MEPLRHYLNSLSSDARLTFCAAIGTTIGYLRKAISTGQLLGEGLCINIEKASAGAVRCEMLRPDVDWEYLRGTAAAGQVDPDADADPDARRIVPVESA